MDINILVAQIVRKGYTQQDAESLALQLVTIARNYGVSTSDLMDELEQTGGFTDLGAFILNNTRRQGYITGKVNPQQPNQYVTRAIIRK